MIVVVEIRPHKQGYQCLLDFLEQIKANPIGYGIGSTGIANKTYPYFL
jgi:hypothetical protein